MKKKGEEEIPQPVEDLQREWQEEDIIIEGRKPDLEEYEEDTAAL